MTKSGRLVHRRVPDPDSVYLSDDLVSWNLLLFHTQTHLLILCL